MNDAIAKDYLVENLIMDLRGQKVILDADLARLYGVENRHLTKLLNVILRDFPKTSCFSLQMKKLQS